MSAGIVADYPEGKQMNLVTFECDAYIEEISNWRREPAFCKRDGCNRKITDVAVERKARLLSELHFAPSRARRRAALRLHVMNSYLLTWGKRNNHSTQYYLSKYRKPVCLSVWLKSYNLHERNFRRWRANTERYDPVPLEHALIGRDNEDANASNQHVNAVVRQFITAVARCEGHPLPIRARDTNQRDLLRIDDCIEHDLFLPLYYSMHGIHRMFLRVYPELTVSWGQFHKLLSNIPNAHASKRECGFYDM